MQTMYATLISAQEDIEQPLDPGRPFTYLPALSRTPHMTPNQAFGTCL